MQETNINPAILQPLFESATNARDKGQAQWWTPIEWGKVLITALPRFRPVILDLSCGAGHLLQAAARGSTNHLLGCDIDPCSVLDGAVKKTVADVTRLYPLMGMVDFHADCFVLNPPWDLHWHREALAGIAESDLPAVRSAFGA